MLYNQIKVSQISFINIQPNRGYIRSNSSVSFIIKSLKKQEFKLKILFTYAQIIKQDSKSKNNNQHQPIIKINKNFNQEWNLIKNQHKFMNQIITIQRIQSFQGIININNSQKLISSNNNVNLILNNKTNSKEQTKKENIIKENTNSLFKQNKILRQQNKYQKQQVIQSKIQIDKNIKRQSAFKRKFQPEVIQVKINNKNNSNLQNQSKTITNNKLANQNKKFKIQVPKIQVPKIQSKQQIISPTFKYSPPNQISQIKQQKPTKSHSSRINNNFRSSSPRLKSSSRSPLRASLYKKNFPIRTSIDSLNHQLNSSQFMEPLQQEQELFYTFEEMQEVIYDLHQVQKHHQSQKIKNIKLSQQLNISQTKLKQITEQKMYIEIHKSIGIVCQEYHTNFTFLMIMGLICFVVGFLLGKVEAGIV